MASTKKNDTTENNDTKVDRAFEVIERMENNEKKMSDVKHGKASQKKQSKKRSGLQFRFSMKALISDQDKQALSQEDFGAGESDLLNFNITVPYLWRIPVIGPAALKVINRIQSDDYQESIKDILKSLKKKKPL